MNASNTSGPIISQALLLEDHAESRKWVGDTLQSAFPGIQITECENIESALKAIRRIDFELALIDLNLPDGSGVDIITELRSSPCQCVVSTIYDDDEHLFPALRAGATGYVLKSQTPVEIASLLKGITNGAPPLSPSIARRILAFYNTDEDNAEPLTPREQEVLTLIAKGYRAKRVAEMLGISINTCQTYVKAIYRKLNINSRAEATREAVRMGIA